jgi:hypothetical protein
MLACTSVPRRSSAALTAFARAAKKALWGPLLHMLDDLGHVGWHDGGCRILADAYLLILPKASRYVLVGSRGTPNAQVQHVLVRVGDHYLDGDGASTEATLLRRWGTLEGVSRARLVPDPDARLADQATEIPRDRALSARLAKELLPGRVVRPRRRPSRSHPSESQPARRSRGASSS